MSLRNALRYSLVKNFTTSAKKPFKIDIIRHAESAGNAHPRRVQGSSVDPAFSLTDKGRDSVKSLLKNTSKPDLLILSPLLRCKQTAEEWFGCDFASIPIRTKIVPDLKEINAGIYEGSYIYQLAYDAQWKLWLTDPHAFNGFPNGETPFEFQHRVLNAFSNICSEYGDTSLHVGVITHGIVMRVLKCYLNQKDLSHLWTYDVTNLEKISLTKFQLDLMMDYQGPKDNLTAARVGNGS